MCIRHPYTARPLRLTPTLVFSHAAEARRGNPLSTVESTSVRASFKSLSLASGSSGKGLCAYPGLAMVFYHHETAPAPDRL